SSITEGIGQGRITANLEGAPVDFAFQIPDPEALEVVFDLAEHEGLLMGGSTGINVAGAIRLGKELGPGHVIVTLLCDSGVRYASKLYNPAFLRSLNLPVPAWLERKGEAPKVFVSCGNIALPPLRERSAPLLNMRHRLAGSLRFA